MVCGECRSGSVCVRVCVVEDQLDGRMDGWMDVRMGAWTGEPMEGWKDGWMDGWMEARGDGLMHGWSMRGLSAGCFTRWIDGRTVHGCMWR